MPAPLILTAFTGNAEDSNSLETMAPFVDEDNEYLREEILESLGYIIDIVPENLQPNSILAWRICYEFISLCYCAGLKSMSSFQDRLGFGQADYLHIMGNIAAVSETVERPTIEYGKEPPRNLDEIHKFACRITGTQAPAAQKSKRGPGGGPR